MMEILIINLTRMGDLLQTTPLMAGIKSTYPDSRITLLVNSAFTEVCRGIPYIDDLMVFDMKGYRLRLIAGKHSLIDDYKILDALVNKINHKEYDLVLNVTHSSVSAVLVSLIRAKEVRGFTISSEGHRVIKHPWVRYFFNVIPNRNYNPFHIVDMYLKIGEVQPATGGLVYHVSEEDRLHAEQILRNEGVHVNDVLVGFHLGASKDEKTWPVSAFAKLADMINKQFGARILLFGTSAEAPLASEFEKYAVTRPVNLAGKTSVGELASLINKSSLFISNDTGPLHVATSAGTTAIDISIANVHFMETGPFGEGHYVIQADLPCSPCGFDVQCNDRVCSSLITPEKVFEVVKVALDRTGEEIELSTEKMEKIQVYRSHFQEDGYIDFIPLIKRSLQVTALYRLIYRQVLNKKSKIDSGIAGMCERICKDVAGLYLNDSISRSIKVIHKDLAVLTKLVSMTGDALHHLRRLQGEVSKGVRDIKVIQDIWKSIEPLEHEIDITGDTHRCLKPLILLFDYSKEALEGDDLEILVNKTIEIYEDLLVKGENMQAIMSGMISFVNAQTENNELAMTL